MVRLNNFLLLAIICIQSVIATNNDDTFLIAYNCTSTNSAPNSSSYLFSLYNLLGSFTSEASQIGFYNSSSGESPNRAYGLYMCRGDVNAQTCTDCVSKAKDKILNVCPYNTDASIWYVYCMIRYSKYPFFGKLAESPWVGIRNSRNVRKDQFPHYVNVFHRTMSTLAMLTANDSSPLKKFQTIVVSVTGVGKLYALAQCTPDLTDSDCHACLTIAMRRFAVSVGGNTFLPSCASRYQTTPFFNSSSKSTYPFFNSTTFITIDKRKRSHIAIAVSIPIVLAALLLAGAWFSCTYNRRAATPSSELEEIITVESLQYDIKTIRAATENFSIHNKLGEGGFGVVYKGTLHNGQEIAVKRLSTSSGQGINEFKTEVLLVAKLQHKNLVRFLGFCLHAKEKLLVYEFLPNSSLDKVLLDPHKHESLDWETRYRIIAGIARGLLYLHEDSRLKIIHRDLKPSNIMLDESMNPKISDFGLARLVGADQIQGDTNRIVGTYGYMAPEYAMVGRFSVKSDVYSFGVIVLEIVSGHKCSSTAFPFYEESLLQRAWRLWNVNAALEQVDVRLKGNFTSEEAAKCIHIGLLCVQEDANKRPTMAPIVSALNGHHVAFPEPIPPQLIATNCGTSAQTSTTFSGSKDITEVCPR